MREFLDENGGHWVVYAVGAPTEIELQRRYLPDSYRRGWLVFESGDRKLRLAPVPAGWDDLPEPALRALLPTAAEVTQTTPRGMPAYRTAQDDDASDATGRR